MSNGMLGLQIGVSALLAHQKALEVINHNIANINTPGYSRQDVVLQPLVMPPNEDPIRGQQGGGVTVSAIRRLSDAFILLQGRSEQQSLGRHEALTEALQQLEIILREPSEEGLNAALDDFFGAFQDLVTSPESPAVRTNVIQQAQHLASLFQTTDQRIEDIRYELNSQVRGTVQQVNDLGQQIADLNERIRKINILGESPNDLMDQRDLLADELAKLVKINYVVTENGTMKVRIGSQELVTDQGLNRMHAFLDAGNGGLYGVGWSATGEPADIDGGTLAGLLEARDGVVPSYQAELNTLANTLLTRVNQLHSAGRGLDNSTGLDLFTGTNAHDIAVNDVIADDVNKLAAASAADAPGDGTNALALSKVGEEPLLPNNTTLKQFYGSIIGRLGLDAQTAQGNVRGQQLLLEHITARRDALSAVSLDEEVVRLLSHQRAYQAAARVISVVDEMMETLLTMAP